MAAASDKLAVVNTAFLDRTILGTGAANFLKGTIWGGAVSVSQAVGACQHASSLCRHVVDYYKYGIAY